MPIRSGFLPKEALQGQDLPSHVLWSDLRFDSIKIRHSKGLTLKEIYNVPCNCCVFENDEIVVKRVEVDGYLGIVLSTRILAKKAIDVSVEYDFVLNNQVLEKLVFQAHLFRPDVVIGDTPLEIRVTGSSNETLPKILISNLGEGTAIIDIDTVPGSDLQKHYPEFVERFMREYRTDIHFSITRLKKHFKEYGTLLSTLEKYLVEPPDFTEEMLRDFENFMNELTSVLSQKHEFAEAVIEALAQAVLRNSEFANFYKFVSEYFNSIGNEKMLIRDPFGFISLSKEPATLKLRLQCIDLLNQICTPMLLPPIVISGDQKGEISLLKLFQWGRKEE
jgi:hypothetical protein